MFGKHALEVRIKRDNDNPNETEKPSVSTDDITRIAKKVVTYIAVGVVGSYAAATALNTASEITVHKYTSEKED